MQERQGISILLILSLLLLCSVFLLQIIIAVTYSKTLPEQARRHWSASDIDDFAFKNACTQALKQFSRPFPFTQLCLVGEGRAGKTALANHFCGRAFHQTESTIGVGIEHLQTDSKLSSHEWYTVPASRRSENFAEEQFVWAVVDQLDGKPSSSTKNIADLMQASVSQVEHHEYPLSFVHPQTVPRPSRTPTTKQQQNERSPEASDSYFSHQASVLTEHADKIVPEAAGGLSGACHMLRQNVSCDFEDLSAPAVRLQKQLVMQRSAEEEPLRMKLMDFGGQKSFYSLHHLYLTRHGVYVTHPFPTENM
jgi:GTPase SAR1 family protein